MANISQASSVSPARPSGWALIWLVISQVIGLISFVPWLVFAALSVMAFDSGASTQAVVFVGAVWCYPVLPISTAIGAWILFARKKYRAALIITSLPLLLAIPLVGYFGYIWLYNTFGGG